MTGQAFASSSVDSHCEMGADAQHSDVCMSADSNNTTGHHDDCDDINNHCGYSCGLALPNKAAQFTNMIRTNMFATLQDSSTQTFPGFPDRPPRA